MEHSTTGGYESLFRESGWSSSTTPDLALHVSMDSPPHAPPLPPSARHEHHHGPSRHLPPPPPPPARPAVDEHGTFVSEVNPVTGNAYSLNSTRRALPVPPVAAPAAATAQSAAPPTVPSYAAHDGHLAYAETSHPVEPPRPPSKVKPPSNRYSRALPHPPHRPAASTASSSFSSGSHASSMSSTHGYNSEAPSYSTPSSSDAHAQRGSPKDPPRPLPRPVSVLPTHMEAAAHFHTDRSKYMPELTRSPMSLESSAPSSQLSNGGSDYFHREVADSTAPTSFSSHHKPEMTHRPQASEVSSAVHDGTTPASVLDHYYTSDSPSYSANDFPPPGALAMEDRDSGPSTPRPSSWAFLHDAPGPSYSHSTGEVSTARHAQNDFGSVSFPNPRSYAEHFDHAEPGGLAYDGIGAHSAPSQATSRPSVLAPSWSEQTQEPTRWVQTKLLLHQAGGYYDDEGGGIYDDYASQNEEEIEEVNEIRFFNPAFLSEAAVQLRDRVSRGHHVKAGITWVGTFTGRDLVVSPAIASDLANLRLRYSRSCHPSFARRQPTGVSPLLPPAPSSHSSGLWKSTGMTSRSATQRTLFSSS